MTVDDSNETASLLRCSHAECVCHRLPRAGHEAIVHCPLHHDPSPSLGVRVLNSAIIIKCKRGCDVGSILDEIAELRIKNRDDLTSQSVHEAPSDDLPF